MSIFNLPRGNPSSVVVKPATRFYGGGRNWKLFWVDGAGVGGGRTRQENTLSNHFIINEKQINHSNVFEILLISKLLGKSELPIKINRGQCFTSHFPPPPGFSQIDFYSARVFTTLSYILLSQLGGGILTGKYLFDDTETRRPYGRFFGTGDWAEK